MNSARMSCAALLASLVVACQGCEGPSYVDAPAQASARNEGSPPRTETPAPSRPLVELTPAALARVKAIVASAGLIESWALRLEASWPEGVCGPQHQMRFDAAPPSSEDHAFESAGIKLVVLKRQVDLLRGTEINFGEKSGEQGFIINTPNFQGESLEKWGPVLQADPLSAAK
jgi:Fe-S cluster assembly iron-binding protein IscA